VSNQGPQAMQQIPEAMIKYDLKVKISMAIFASALDVLSNNAKVNGDTLNIDKLPNHEQVADFANKYANEFAKKDKVEIPTIINPNLKSV